MKAEFKTSLPGKAKPDQPLTMKLWNCDTLKWDRVYNVRDLDKDQARQYVPLTRRQYYDWHLVDGYTPLAALMYALER